MVRRAGSTGCARPSKSDADPEPRVLSSSRTSPAARRVYYPVQHSEACILGPNFGEHTPSTHSGEWGSGTAERTLSGASVGVEHAFGDPQRQLLFQFLEVPLSVLVCVVAYPEHHRILVWNPPQNTEGPPVPAVVPEDPSLVGGRDHPSVTVVAVAAFLLGHVGLEHLVLGALAQNLLSSERRGPAEHFVRGGEQPAVAAKVPVWSVIGPGMIERPAFGLCVLIVLHRHLLGSPLGEHVPGLPHARRLEKLGGQELLVAPAGDLLDDRGQDTVSEVGVAVFGSRSRTQLGLERAIQHVLPRQHLVVAAELFGQSRRVRQQMMHADGTLVVGHRTDKLAYRIAHAQLPHHLQLQDRRGGELLGHRHGVVNGVAPCGDLRLSIGEAEAPAVRDLVAAGGPGGPRPPFPHAASAYTATRTAMREHGRRIEFARLISLHHTMAST